MLNLLWLLFSFSYSSYISIICLFFSILILVLVIIVVGLFDRNYSSYQFIFLKFFKSENNISYCLGFGLDGLGLVFILLTAFLFVLIFLSTLKYNFLHNIEYCYCLISLECFLILVFSALDLFTFFFLFESVLIPMFLIIGLWGSLNRKVYASLLFFLFTLGGSLCLLFVILILYFEYGTLNFTVLSKVELLEQKQLILSFLTFLSLAVKIPMIPFHIWLPEAHVEAPSAGSVILAGVLLKLGGYGILRILIPFFPYGVAFFVPFIFTSATLSILYCSLTAIRQLDLKRIIAYSSVAHMNLVVLGLFSNVIEGIIGGTFLMVGHGLVSALLFFLIGFLYERYGTRLLGYYGGLIKIMPLYSVFFLLGCLANLGLPGTCNFIGELLIFCSLLQKNKIIFLLVLSSVVLAAIYSLYLYSRLISGSLTSHIKNYSDLAIYEIWICLLLLFVILLLGFNPNCIVSLLNSVHFLILERIKF